MKSDGHVKVLSAELLSSHNKAVIEAGEAILLDSLSVGREFSKFMITNSLGAIPIYMSVLKLYEQTQNKNSNIGIGIAFCPIIIFLFAAIIFTIAYFPRMAKYSLDVIEEIDAAIGVALRIRRRLIIVGFILFILGIVSAVTVVFLQLWVRTF